MTDQIFLSYKHKPLYRYMQCHTTIPNGISGHIFVSSATPFLSPMATQRVSLIRKPNRMEKQWPVTSLTASPPPGNCAIYMGNTTLSGKMGLTCSIHPTCVLNGFPVSFTSLPCQHRYR